MQPNRPVVKIHNLVKHYDVGRSIFGTSKKQLKAVDGVSLEIMPGQTIGVVGESGCGKSTFGKTVLRVLEPTAGSIEFLLDDNYVDITHLGERDLRRLRPKMNMVFQDPFSSLNPRKTVRFIIGEPLILQHRLRGRKLDEKVGALLEMVGLDPLYMERFPHAFSGGQRQRIALARALATEPVFVVADEPVSALDVSVQSQILNLFLELQEKLHLSCVFISHDIKVVRHVSDYVIIMYLGRVVEQGSPNDVCTNTKHPYSEALLSAVPLPHVKEKRNRIILAGDLPDPVNPPPGCHFHTRCSYKTDLCMRQSPTLTAVQGAKDHFVACHHHEKLRLRGLV